MSTRSSIKWLEQIGDQPGFHLFEDCDVMASGADAPVYLSLMGVLILELAPGATGASVTVEIPRGMARAMGLLT